MTGTELISKLEASGTGASKIAALRDLFGSKKPSVGAVIHGCIQLGHVVTAQKAAELAGVESPDVTKPGALFDSLDAARADNDKLKAKVAELEKQLGGKK